MMYHTLCLKFLFKNSTKKSFRCYWNYSETPFNTQCYIASIQKGIVTFSQQKQMLKYDVVVVGGGIIGTATARELLLRHPRIKLAILEKENTLAAHQSGHNSGVIHAGIYYTPGSLKARLCTEGLELTYKYCDEHQIPYKKCGKLIVAVAENELARLDSLFKRGLENKVKDLSLIGPEEIKKIEPNCWGLKAVWSPNTGIVDWAEVNKSFGRECQEKGADIYLNFYVTKFRNENRNFHNGDKTQYPVVVCGGKNAIQCKYVVTCGGLFSDKLAIMSGCSAEPQIIPFRGEYLVLKPHCRNLVKTNIYPVPNPELPFLGVHFTPRMDGGIWLGPNAVLALKREGYNIFDFSLSDTWETIRNRGLQKLALAYAGYGIRELYRGINIAAQVRLLQNYVPKLQISDVMRGPTGVRAQALDRSGNLVDDFVLDYGKSSLGRRILNVRNAPSPAATSSLAIAKLIVNRIEEQFSM